MTLLYTPAMNREQNNLMLWSASPQTSNSGPVHKFYGHMDAVQEFAWRNINPMTNRDEFQLVTWGRDSHMTLWPIGGQIKAMCGQEPDEKILADNAQVAETLKKATDIRETVEAIEHLDVASNSPSNNETEDIMLKSASFSELETGSGIGSAPGITMRPSTATLLKQELSNIDYGEKIVIHKIDLNQRHCIFQTETHLHVIYLDVKFPYNYPMEPPEFGFLYQTTLRQERGNAIIKRLKNIAIGLKVS